MKSKINFLLPALTLIFVLQSCLKGPNPIIKQPDDKLLLSKVTGTNNPAAWNFFEYTRDPTTNLWDYLSTYSYGNEHFGWDNYKPLQQVGFQNTGNWSFTYNNLLPDKIIDNSNPGTDQGYWKLYYNEKGQVIKTGLAFSITADPTQFEFYQYDKYNNLSSLVYGEYVDTPYFKNTYTYDAAGNLTQWQLLFPNGYTNADAATGKQIFNTLANSPGAEKFIGKNGVGLMKKVLSAHISRSTAEKSSSITSFQGKASGDSNVIYQAYFTATITNDGKINPYHQQGGLLFFPASRFSSVDINPNYIALQKSNATYMVLNENPDFGTFTPRVSNFSYTYNKLGYPVTSHEDTADPDAIWFPINYTSDRQYEYISNY